MTPHRRLLCSLVVASVALAACGSGDDGSNGSNGDEIRLVSMPARVASTADPRLAGEAVSSFGLSLFDAAAAAAADDANVIVSPLSVAIALALAEPGASGDAVEQFHELLAIDDPTAWRSSLSALEASLESREPEPLVVTDDVEQSPGELRVNVANAAFTRPGYPFRADYLDVLGTVFGAHLEELDFSDPDAAAARINEFISDETDGHITDLVKPEAIDPEATVLALVNALLLQASWQTTFEVDATQDDTFTRLDGSTVTVPMMSGASDRSGKGEGWVGASKALVGGLRLDVVLPDEGRFDDVTARLGEVFDELATSPNPSGELAMPRFETRVNTRLTDVLQAMGLVAPFGPGSMLGVADDPDTLISDVLHETWMSVDEDGIEAAAATVVLMAATAAPSDVPVPVVLDRPFVLRIVDSTTGATLFVGRVLDPTA
jgi:serpin B